MRLGSQRLVRLLVNKNVDRKSTKCKRILRGESSSASKFSVHHQEAQKFVHYYEKNEKNMHLQSAGFSEFNFFRNFSLFRSYF